MLHLIHYTSGIVPSPFDLQAEDSQNTLTKMSELIKPNNWFEVFTDYSHPVRHLKRSSIMELQAKLIFVDYLGNKVIEKDIESFITELKNDHSILEYALGIVIISIAVKS